MYCNQLFFTFFLIKIKKLLLLLLLSTIQLTIPNDIDSIPKTM